MSTPVHIGSRTRPVRVGIGRDLEAEAAPVRMDTGAEIITMTAEEATALAGALATAALVGQPPRTLRRGRSVDDDLRALDGA